MYRLCVLLLLGCASIAQAHWLKAETPGFTVYSQGNEAALRQKAEELQAYDALLRMVTGVKAQPSPTRLSVYIVSSGADLVPLGLGGTGIAGVYFAHPNMLAAFVARYESASFDKANTTLFHEYAHHFMFQYGATAYPIWYTEGFAEFVSTARIGDGSAEIGRVEPGRSYDLIGAWIPLDLMLAQKPNLKNWGYAKFYAQAWFTVHYINSDPARAAGMRRYLALLADGKDPIVSFEPAFGVTRAQFYDGLKNYQRGGLNGYRIKWTPPPTSVSISALPDSADDLLLAEVQLHTTDSDDRGSKGLLKKIRGSTDKWPDDQYARRVRAEAEIELGDAAMGLALIDAMIADAPGDAELAYLRGAALLEQAKAKDLSPEAVEVLHKSARMALTRANALHPDDYRILFAHVTASARPLSDTEYAVLMRARDLAPQVNEMTLYVAERQIERGDKTAARALLTMLESDPHSSKSVDEQAKKLLADLAGSATPTAQ